MQRASIVLPFAALSWIAACSSSGDAVPTGDAGDDVADSIVVDATDAGADAPVDGETSAPRPLDCVWAKDPKNCWRELVRSIDACLGNVAGSTEKGTTSTDGKSCTYATGRAVAFAVPFDALNAGADRDFTITRSGATCLHYVEHAASTGFVVTAPTGTLAYSAIANDVTVTCPDGTAYEGDAKKLALACGDAILGGGVPGTQIEASPDRFELSGSVAWDFDCAPPTSDAGVDGDAGD